jgi:hypothetical protein
MLKINYYGVVQGMPVYMESWENVLKPCSGWSQLKPEPLISLCQKLWYRINIKHIGSSVISVVPCT